MSNEDNLKLWKSVEKTNPNYTKKAKIGGHSITSIAPQYQVMMVTEKFGTYGLTWGFKNIDLDYSLVEKYDMVTFKGVFFFPGGQFEIINSCKLFMDRDKKMLDDNFAKKIETDTLTKAISKLGFNADIFLGKFDDVRYMNELNEEFKTDEQKESEAKRDAYIAKQAADKLQAEKLKAEAKKPLKTTQFDTVVKSRNKEHVIYFLENTTMSEAQRKVLTAIKDVKDGNTKT